jgi:hypothetical protein
MENKQLKLPIGIQTFETIRSEGFIYIDKTKHLINLIDSGNVYFLARPRRFGKSLTISTFHALFSGKKELFKGLDAEEFLNRPDFKPSPVIWLDMSSITTYQGIEVFEASLKQLTFEVAKRLGVDIPQNLPSSDVLRNLIINASEKYNQKVVILLDEYDSPYTDFVNDLEMAEKVRDVLRLFYKQIKVNDGYIRFTFITGISKFAKFGVFSALNTLRDISMSPKYAEICGLTEAEIIKYFPDYLEDTANVMCMTTEELILKMRHFYNGFSFDSSAQTRLYNPFSTLLFFADQEFSNYWMNSGRSKVIADYLKNRNLTVEQFRNFPVSKEFAQCPGDVDTTPAEGFLYQCGYLTLRPGISGELSLDYPNTEVLNSMSRLLAQNILPEHTYNYSQNDLWTALMLKDAEKLVEVFNSLLAAIPYDDFSAAAKNSISYNNYPLKPQEWLYRSTILAFLRGCGVVVTAEMHTNLGRADLVVSHKGITYIIEIKIAYEGESPAQKAEEALRQIADKNYAKPYPDAVCIGMAIDNSVRQITDVKTS